MAGSSSNKHMSGVCACEPIHGTLQLAVPDQVRREHEELRKRRLDEFMAGFNCISLRLKEMYQMITLGGDAELELVDSLDPFSEVWVAVCILRQQACHVGSVTMN